MKGIHKAWASTFGIGFIKGGGTVAALVCCLCVYGCWQWDFFTPAGLIIVTLLITLSGVWSGNVVEKDWGEDSSKVVVDEVAGMCISLLFVKMSTAALITGFVLFRFFDIAKPFGVRKMENFPGGWGVMADDVLAGVYANISLHLILLLGNAFFQWP
jgi:phosphatidylglycerophosphatase A